MDRKQQYSNLHDEEEDEETLSFCDLPLHCDATDSEDFSDHRLLRSPSSDQQLFQFYTQQQTASYPPENIIFCGKIIPYRQPISIHNNSNQQNPRKQLSRWNSDSFFRPKTSPRKGISTSKSLPLPLREKHVPFPPRKLSAKSRWHFLAFGWSPRFPMEMELTDMRTRQKRRGPPTLFASGGAAEVAVSGGRRRVKGLWGFIRALACGGHANAVVKASFGCV